MGLASTVFKKVHSGGIKIWISLPPCAIFAMTKARGAADIQAWQHEKHGLSHPANTNTLLYNIQDVHKNIARCLYSPCKGFGEPGTHKTTLPCGVNAPKSRLP